MNKDTMDWSTSSYIADTGHLSLAQHGAYVLILMTMWRCGGWIAADERHLANICRTTLKQWRKIAPDVLALLIEKEGKLTQKRLLTDHLQMQSRVSANAVNGRHGGIAKSLKTHDPVPEVASISPEVRQPIATATPPTEPVSALTLPSKKVDSNKEAKKVRNTHGSTLDDGWMPGPSDLGYGMRLGLCKEQVLAMGEDMRLWAKANANRAVGRKADWTAAFQGWMRREAPKVLKSNGGSNGNDRQGGKARIGGFAEIGTRIGIARRERAAAGGVRDADGPDDPGLDLGRVHGER